jgi:hypothetical protein
MMADVPTAFGRSMGSTGSRRHDIEAAPLDRDALRGEQLDGSGPLVGGSRITQRVKDSGVIERDLRAHQ